MTNEERARAIVLRWLVGPLLGQPLTQEPPLFSEGLTPAIAAALDEAERRGHLSEMIAESEEAAVEKIQADERRRVYEEAMTAPHLKYLQGQALADLRRLCGLEDDDG